MSAPTNGGAAAKAASGAPSPTPPPGPLATCAALAVASKPILELPAGDRRLPLALHALGFSRSGRFAWLEGRRYDEDERFPWVLHVINLASDRMLVERLFWNGRPGLQPLCARHGKAIAAILAKQGIAADAAALALEQPGDAPEPTTVAVRRGRKDPARARTQFEVMLQFRGRSKRLGHVWRTIATRERPPTACHARSACYAAQSNRAWPCW